MARNMTRVRFDMEKLSTDDRWLIRVQQDFKEGEGEALASYATDTIHAAVEVRTVSEIPGVVADLFRVYVVPFLPLTDRISVTANSKSD